MSKYEHAKFIIERFDHYYDSVNNKGTLYIGLNTFILGGICVGYLALQGKVDPGFFTWALFMLLVIANTASIAFTIAAIMPFTKDNPENPHSASLIYFGGIARHTLPHFKEKFERSQDTDMLDDLVQQVHCLANGLKNKYKHLKWAGVSIVVQFAVMLPLLFLIVKNLKQ